MCTWCAHPIHAAGCPRRITAGRLTGSVLQRRLDDKPTPIPCPCRKVTQ